MLHPDTKSKTALLGAIQNAIDAFTQNTEPVKEKLAEEYPDAAAAEQARQQIIQNLKAAYAGASEEAGDPKWFVPRDRIAAIMQSAMNIRAQREPPQVLAAASAAVPVAAAPAGEPMVAEPPPLAPAPLEKYGPLDPEWVECVVDGFKTLLEGDATFVTHTALTDFMFDVGDVKIAIVGDWGADNDAAKKVAAQIKANNPDIVIHLGDIYYAGQNDEAVNALSIWPMLDAAGNVPAGSSFALNGNHEMFCGGRALFGKVLPKFGQKASYFGLRTSKWQILAFDSAYEEHRLLPPDEATGSKAGLAKQWEWLVDKMKNSNLPTILLSHHEPISAFADEHADGVNLRQDFPKFIAAAGRGIFAWFFGHEHRCTFYDNRSVGGVLLPAARLIGHGCIPHSAPPPNQKPDPGCEDFTMMNFAKNTDGDAMSGFALLTFQGSNIDIQYLNEDGTKFTEEVWEAPASLPVS